MSKAFEKEVFRQVYRYLSESSLLSKFQSGFRSRHSTVTALIQMCDEWLENMDNGRLNGVVFIDIKKAFDSIDHRILLNKMNEQFGIFGVELKWFESYLTNREQQYNVNGELSSNKIITCGVPQGSILGPLLFLLYINDLPDCLKSTNPSMYADDNQIFSSSYDANELVVSLNSDLSHVCNWLKENRLQMHPSKCKMMFIGSPYNLNNIMYEEPVVANAKPISRTATQMCLLRDNLQRFQSRAARVLTGANYDTRSADLLNMLSWDTLENRRSGAKSVLMYKILNDHTAPGLRGIICI